MFEGLVRLAKGGLSELQKVLRKRICLKKALPMLCGFSPRGMGSLPVMLRGLSAFGAVIYKTWRWYFPICAAIYMYTCMC